MSRNWRARATSVFDCEKQPAHGTQGMIVTNHPLASAAGAEMLAAGGNAIDATIAALFTLTVVEPMMVGIVGGGMAHLRLADGRHIVIDGMSTAPGATGSDTFTLDPHRPPGTFEATGRANAIGPASVAVPGNLKAWCETLARFGTMPLADVIEPAIRHAARGFRATPFLTDCVRDAAADLARDKGMAKVYFPDGDPIRPGARVVQSDYAETLRLIASEGAATLHGGALGRALCTHMERNGGHIRASDLSEYRCMDREAIRGSYRGFEITGPPPPSSSGVHVVQMLNILESFDIGGMGFGAPDGLHLLAEVLKIAFADRSAATADPAFVNVPVGRLISKPYAADRRARIELARTQDWQAGVAPAESSNTTHLTAADGLGNVVASTQTINSLFGARFIIPGTGVIPNNYMVLFDPRPGRALSLVPGKRIPTSMAPLIALENGMPRYALGLPGGLRIFGCAMQGLINLIDHGMSLQEAVEAPRVWTQGLAVEVETGYPDAARDALSARGHEVLKAPHVGGGMNAIGFGPDGSMTGAACWRADGMAIGLGGGHARAGVRFWPDRTH